MLSLSRNDKTVKRTRKSEGRREHWRREEHGIRFILPVAANEMNAFADAAQKLIDKIESGQKLRLLPAGVTISKRRLYA